MTDVPNVDVLLATYNGAGHLDEQIDSILAQRGVEVRLTVADDGSSDDTVGVLESYARNGDLTIAHRDRVGGFVDNFGRLLSSVTTDWFALSDQDDVWHADKLRSLLESTAAPADHQVMAAFCDMHLVDEDGASFGTRFLDEMKAPRRPPRVQEVPLQNWMSGNATIYRREVLDAALPIPPRVISHDWWLAVVAACSGEVRFVDRALVDYRQHAENVEGVKRSPVRRVLSNPRVLDASMRKKQIQLDSFAQAFAARPPLQRTEIAGSLRVAARSSSEPSGWRRIREFRRSGLTYPDLTRRLGHAAWLLTASMADDGSDPDRGGAAP